MSDAPRDVQPFTQQASKLGSLSQSARKQSLRSARSILLFVGILTIAANSFLLAQSDSEVNDALEAQMRSEGLDRKHVDPAKLEQLRSVTLRLAQVIYGGTIVLGVVFVILGIVIYKAPVAITVTGMILYIAFNIVFGLLNPASLAAGVIIKVVIVVVMAKAISAAVAYQREQVGTASL